jgi:hypothetical protein
MLRLTLTRIFQLVMLVNQFSREMMVPSFDRTVIGGASDVIEAQMNCSRSDVNKRKIERGYSSVVGRRVMEFGFQTLKPIQGWTLERN